MRYFAVILYLFIILLLLAERWYNDRALSSFRFVIHVNGIRGKTDVCRRLDAALRANGFRVFTKTTGTHPCYLDTQGREHQLTRLGRANIREQMRIIRRAFREHADVLILECMAVRPELQSICQYSIVKSQYVVITNLRRDHLYELGETPEEIARSFCSAIPKHGTLFLGSNTCQSIFQQACDQLDSRLLLCASPEELPPLQANQSLVNQICAHLGVLPTQAAPVTDFGASKTYHFRGHQGQHLEFLNLFSVNDPDSTLLQLKQINLQRPILFLYNHRPDRPDRFLLFQRHFFPVYPKAPIWIMGRGSQLPVRLLKRQGRPCLRRCWQDIFSLDDRTLIVGVGSIKGDGERLVLHMEANAEHE